MVFYLRESPGSEESRRLGVAWCRLEGRDKEEHPSGQGGVGVLQLRAMRTTLPAGQQQDTALQAPSRVCNYI